MCLYPFAIAILTALPTSPFFDCHVLHTQELWVVQHSCNNYYCSRGIQKKEVVKILVINSPQCNQGHWSSSVESNWCQGLFQRETKRNNRTNWCNIVIEVKYLTQKTTSHLRSSACWQLNLNRQKSGGMTLTVEYWFKNLKNNIM